MVSQNVDIQNWYETLKNQSLERNDKSVAVWSKYKNDLGETKSLLSLIPRKVKHNVMVPIGSKALMPGKIVHTNEYLVNLGETWFVKRTAYQAIEICDRRIKTCDEMLKKLEKEMQLIVNKSRLPAEQEAFGNEEHPEIIEYVTEEENEEWKKQHRLKEKLYRQELAELRKKEKKTIETEEDLWKHLDELELQEELEDELNRLNAENSSEEDYNEEIEEEKGENNEECKNNSKQVKVKQVSFACDFESSDDEPLMLDIKHSENEPVSNNSNSNEILSPSDIYNQYLKLENKTPLVILKKKAELTEKNNLEIKQYKRKIYQEDDLDNVMPSSTGVLLHDVIERNATSANIAPKTDSSIQRRVSKFKSARMKNN